MPLSKYKNVVFDKASNYEFYQLAESDALIKTFTFLLMMMKNIFDDYIFFIFAGGNPKIEPDSLYIHSNKKKVLLYISEESGIIPYNISQYYHAIFKAYLKTDTIGLNNIFNFPLCCVKNVPSLSVLPMINRKYSVFFSGNLNINRVNFYLSLLSLRIPTIPNFSIRLSIARQLLVISKSNFDSRFSNAYIHFTKGFMQGLSTIDYGHFIANSKIVLCPSGLSSSECFRHYEAMRAGCIIISEKLPDTYFYQNSPIIQVHHWRDGLRKVAELLENPIEMERLGDLTKKWWVERCSEEATAQFVFDNLTSLRAG